MENEKVIEEMADICYIHKDIWSDRKRGFCYSQAKALHDKGYGNIKQALTEFVDVLDSKAWNVDQQGVRRISIDIIKKTLKEYLDE